MTIKVGVLTLLVVLTSASYSQKDTLFVGKQKFAIAKMKLLNPPPAFEVQQVNDTVVDIQFHNGTMLVSEQVFIDSTTEKPMVTRYALSPATIVIRLPYREVQNTAIVLKSGKELIYFNNCSVDELVEGVKSTLYVHNAENGRLLEYWNPDDQLTKGAKIKRPGMRLIIKDLYYTKAGEQYALDIEVMIIAEH